VISGHRSPPQVVHYLQVRLALVRHPSAPLATILSYLPELTVPICGNWPPRASFREGLRKYLQAEVQRRVRASEKSSRGERSRQGPFRVNRE